jgi:glycogen operon protein
VKSVGVFLNGGGIKARDRRGQPITDDNFLLYFNASADAVQFRLPAEEYGATWELVVDTANEPHPPEGYAAGESVEVGGRSVIVMRAA